jgi:type III restriction enzyme
MENYIVRHLIDRPEVDYDSHAGLLFKLAGQMVVHLRSYLPDEEAVENVARTRGKQLADVIFVQMKTHLRRTPVDYQTRVVRSFRMLEAMPVTVSSDRVRPLNRPADPLSATPSFVFTDLRKCPWPWVKFSSDAERRLAALLDSERAPGVMRWLKPGRGQFEIEYEPGRRYEPDFVVETEAEMFIIEVKAANQLEDNVVKAKAKAAQRWVELANSFADKQWRYAIIRDDNIRESSSFAGLL